MPKDNKKEIKELYDDLCHELRSFRKGMKFYSIRNMQDRCKKSRNVIETVYKRLAEEGQLVINDRSAPLVGTSLYEGKFNILLIQVLWPSQRIIEYNNALQEVLEKTGCYRVSIFKFDPLKDNSSTLKQITKFNCDVILFKSPAGIYSKMLIANLLISKTPVVFLADCLYCAGINLVDTQTELTGMLAAEHLIKKGHTKIALVHSEPWMPDLQRIYNGFNGFSKINDINVIDVQLNIHKCDYTPVKTKEKFLEYYRDKSLDMTAIFASSDYSAASIISALEELGKRVPEDIAVICCHNCSYANKHNPSITSVGCDFYEIAQVISEGLNSLLKNGTFGIRYVYPKVIKRLST